jgi:hypothetical protein
MNHKRLSEGQEVEYSRLWTGGRRGQRRTWAAGYVVVQPIADNNPRCAVIRKVNPSGLLEQTPIFAPFTEIRAPKD